MSSIATPASFSGLPLELKHNILTYCEPRELAVLSRTARSYKREAQRLLYGTISLNYRSPASFDCIRVLASNKVKASLVQAFSLTLWDDSSRETDRYVGEYWDNFLPKEVSPPVRGCIEDNISKACYNMENVVFFSFKMGWNGYLCDKIMYGIQRLSGRPSLSTLFIEAFAIPRDLSFWVAQFPRLEMLGIWHVEYCPSAQDKLIVSPLLAESSDSGGVKPVIIGILPSITKDHKRSESGRRLDLTIYDYDEPFNLNLNRSHIPSPRVFNSLLGYKLYEDLGFQVGDESGSFSVHAPDLSKASFEKLIPVVNVFLDSCLGAFDKCLILRAKNAPKNNDDISWDGLVNLLQLVLTKPRATPVFFQITSSFGLEKGTVIEEMIKEVGRRGVERLVEVFNDPALDKATFRGGEFFTHFIASEKPQEGSRRKWFVPEEVTEIYSSGRRRWCAPGKWTDEIYIDAGSLMEKRHEEGKCDSDDVYYDYYQLD
ncbi:hypothetical protein D9611_014353 [Ephemerocybe angulata]|uniref:F-box domain-containing protein n=1 Tax=Ephemerocybe angulata TaxID=980116 RepID=A0A8H5B806_9AGAR|nr:hypothetical protein D9611_014353 [Tulosesus angulatus]